MAGDPTLLRPLQVSDLISQQKNELARLADWWRRYGPDRAYGGYVGEIGNKGEIHAIAPKRAVAQARICWFFSVLAKQTRRGVDLDLANLGRDNLLDNFFDRENGGVFWETDYTGIPTNTRKQAYAQAFCIYALSAHYGLTADPVSRDHAFHLFELIETKFRDHEQLGYWEAKSENWAVLDDVRLSEHDVLAPKSMNTHLHILEAYSELYAVTENGDVGDALKGLIGIHVDRIFDASKQHLWMFWTTDWRDTSTHISYGHDIEASWLLWEAAERLGCCETKAQVRPVVVALADAVLERASGPTGELFNDLSLIDGTLDKTRIWWGQAEGMIGHLNAYALTGNENHLRRVVELWKFIQAHVIDQKTGEWRWYSSLDEQVCPYRAGPWKTAYHNGRSLIECINRLHKLEQSDLPRSG